MTQTVNHQCIHQHQRQVIIGHTHGAADADRCELRQDVGHQGPHPGQQEQPQQKIEPGEIDMRGIGISILDAAPVTDHLFDGKDAVDQGRQFLCPDINRKVIHPAHCQIVINQGQLIPGIVAVYAEVYKEGIVEEGNQVQHVCTLPMKVAVEQGLCVPVEHWPLQEICKTHRKKQGRRQFRQNIPERDAPVNQDIKGNGRTEE